MTVELKRNIRKLARFREAELFMKPATVFVFGSNYRNDALDPVLARVCADCLEKLPPDPAARRACSYVYRQIAAYPISTARVEFIKIRVAENLPVFFVYKPTVFFLFADTAHPRSKFLKRRTRFFKRDRRILYIIVIDLKAERYI